MDDEVDVSQDIMNKFGCLFVVILLVVAIFLFSKPGNTESSAANACYKTLTAGIICP